MSVYLRMCVCVCACTFMQDKQELPWWLGVSYKGIGQYDQQDKLKPRKVGGRLCELLGSSHSCIAQSPLGLVVFVLKFGRFFTSKMLSCNSLCSRSDFSCTEVDFNPKKHKIPCWVSENPPEKSAILQPHWVAR